MIKPNKILSWAIKKPSRSINKRRNYAKLKKAIDNNEPIIGRYPLSVQVETTSLCNGKCRFCAYGGSWNQRNPGTMSRQIYEKIIQNLKKYKIDTFYPYGCNEPLLDKELFDRIRYAVENLNPGCVELSTNLSVLHDKMIGEIKGLFPMINHKIVVSFHGVSKESYEDQMGLDYDRALKNVLSLVELSQ
ncbi:MAG: radical SAM protein, partial [Candidatus Aminicenantales bacterium]